MTLQHIIQTVHAEDNVTMSSNISKKRLKKPTPIVNLQLHLLTENNYNNNLNKKLCYRKAHSVSVVLSWCNLWHFSIENLLMANQQLLRNWPWKLPNLANNAK